MKRIFIYIYNNKHNNNNNNNNNNKAYHFATWHAGRVATKEKMPPKEDPKIDSRETLCWQTFLEKARYQAIDILVGFRIHGRSL